MSRNSALPALLTEAMALQADATYAEALLLYERAIKIAPWHVEAHRNHGIVLHALGQADRAVQSFARAIGLAPSYAPSHFNLGNVLRSLGRHEDALASYRRAVQLRPGYTEAGYNCAVLLHNSGQHAAALAELTAALTAHPAFAAGQNLCGNVLMHMQRPRDALARYDAAIAAAPGLADAHNNRGSALRELGDQQGARASYLRAIAIRSDFVEAHWNVAMADLLCGSFSAGWTGYEWRKKLENWERPDQAGPPHWDGKARVTGRSILVRSEQGYGDTIQFARYITLLQRRGAKVVFAVQPPLRRLISAALPETEVVDENTARPDCDFQIDLLSLPAAVKTELASIPPPLPLRPLSQDNWAHLLPPTRPRIGIAWSGNPAHIADHTRSIPLAAWHQVLRHAAGFVAIQKDLRPEDTKNLQVGASVSHFGDELGDFADTSGLIAELDLVISVDTSTAHLAASMGKTVWLLLAATPDWRWLLDRRDTPWYPTVRLFRQRQPGNWAGVFAEVSAALDALGVASGA